MFRFFSVALVLVLVCSSVVCAGDWTVTATDETATAYAENWVEDDMSNVYDYDDELDSTNIAYADPSVAFDPGFNATSSMLAVGNADDYTYGGKHVQRAESYAEHSGSVSTAGWHAKGAGSAWSWSEKTYKATKNGTMNATLELTELNGSIPDEVYNIYVKAWAGDSWVEWTYTSSTNSWARDGVSWTNGIPTYLDDETESDLEDFTGDIIICNQSISTNDSIDVGAYVIIGGIENDETGTTSTRLIKFKAESKLTEDL